MEDGTIVFFSTSAVFKNKKNVFALNTILSFYKIPTLGYCVRKHKVNQRELKQMEPILNSGDFTTYTVLSFEAS